MFTALWFLFSAMISAGIMLIPDQIGPSIVFFGVSGLVYVISNLISRARW